MKFSPAFLFKTDDEIDAFVRQSVESAYHPSCSCPMGTDAMAVVDPQTRVHGIQGLRVVDSSIFPTIPNGNLNAPTIMVAERAADMIRGGNMLLKADVEVAGDALWQSRQRPVDDAPDRLLGRQPDNKNTTIINLRE